MEDEVTMEQVKGIENIEKHSFGKLCCLCNDSSGCTIQCTRKGCGQSWHPLCGLESGWHMKISVENDKELAFSRTTLCSKHFSTSKILPETSGNEVDLQKEARPPCGQMDTEYTGDSKGSDLCSCLVPWDGVEFMIQCDLCEIWYHGACVGIQETDISKMDTFVCSRCRPTVSSQDEVCKDLKAPDMNDSLETNKAMMELEGAHLIPAASARKGVEVPKRLQSADETSITEEMSAASGTERAQILFASSKTGEKSSEDRQAPNKIESENSDGGPDADSDVVISNSRVAKRGLSQPSASIQQPDLTAVVDVASYVVTCISAFLGDVIDELEHQKEFVSTQSLHDKFKKYCASRGQNVPLQARNVSWFGRYTKSICGMHGTKNANINGFKIDIDELRRTSSLSKNSLASGQSTAPCTQKKSKKANIASDDAADYPLGVENDTESGEDSNCDSASVEESRHRAASGNHFSESDQMKILADKLPALKPRSGLRVVYKWNELEWYEGTIGKNKTKASYNKHGNQLRYKASDWWFVTWDDGEVTSESY
jgi:hypothetical protein